MIAALAKLSAAGQRAMLGLELAPALEKAAKERSASTPRRRPGARRARRRNCSD